MNTTRFNNELPKYCIINPEGTYAGVFCVTYEEALQMAAEREGRVIYELKEVAQ